MPALLLVGIPFTKGKFYSLSSLSVCSLNNVLLFCLFLYRIAPCDSDGSMKYDFVKIRDLVNKKKETVVDLICIVNSFGDRCRLQSKGRHLVTPSLFMSLDTCSKNDASF